MLRRMLRRQLRAEWLLLSAIAAMMVIGVTVFVGLRSAHRNLRRAQSDYYRETRFADFWIRFKKAPAAVLRELEATPGVARITARISHYATVDLPEVDKPINALVLSLPEDRQPALNALILRSGSYFSPTRANEVIVIDQFARAHKIRPGASIALTLNGRKERMLVVGTAISSEFTYLLGPGSIVPAPNQFGVFFVKRSFAEDLLDFDGAANEVVGRWGAGDPMLHRVRLEQIERQLEPYGVLARTERSRQSSHQFLDGEIRGLGVSATVLPTAFLIAAALVLNVLMMRVARRQRQIIGTLKALGFEDRTLMVHFLELRVIVGTAAGAVGSICGYAASLAMTRIYLDYFEFPRLTSGFYVDIYAWGWLLSLTCAVFGSLQGAKTLYRLTPAEAMRPAPPRGGGAIWLERITRLWRRLTTPWRLSLRSIWRQRFRTFTSLFATSMGSALLTSGLLMVHTVGFLVDFQFRELARSDSEIMLEDERGIGVLDEVRRLPGVDDAEPVYYLNCTIRHGVYRYRTSITGLIPGARLTRPQMVDATPIPLPRSGLIINRRLADILHVDVGDDVTVRPTRGDRAVRQTRVVAIADGFLGVTAYADIRHVSRLAGERLALNSVQIATDRTRVNDRLRNRRLKETPAVAMVLSRHELIESMEKTIVRNMMVFIVVLVGFSGTVFLGSLLNASLISLSERAREVATLLAIGYSPWRIGGMFLRESALVGLTGMLCGLPLGYGLMWLSVMPYRTNDLFRIPLVTAPWVWWTSSLLGVVFIVGAHGFVQRRIDRLDFRDVLNVRE